MYTSSNDIACFLLGSWGEGWEAGRLFSASFLYLYSFTSRVRVAYSRNKLQLEALPAAIPGLWPLKQADPSVATEAVE